MAEPPLQVKIVLQQIRAVADDEQSGLGTPHHLGYPGSLKPLVRGLEIGLTLATFAVRRIRGGNTSGIRLVWADGGYAGKLISWVQQWCGWVLEIVMRDKAVRLRS